MAENPNITTDSDDTKVEVNGAVPGSGDGSSTDTRTDVSDSSGTVVQDTEDLTVIASGAASVAVSDDGDGTATVEVGASDTDTHTSVSDDGTEVVADTGDIDFGAGVDVSDDGDGTVSVTAKPKHAASGQVASGNAATVRTVEVADGSTYSIYEAGLLLADGQPAPTDLDLVIATMDNAGAATRQSIVVDGDGTKQNDLSGSPLASYSNTSGSKQTVAVMVDNGQFNAGTGSNQEISAHFDEEVAA